jgi:hypothetical protein
MYIYGRVGVGAPFERAESSKKFEKEAGQIQILHAREGFRTV